jgi:hypothetical protein
MYCDPMCKVQHPDVRQTLLSAAEIVRRRGLAKGIQEDPDSKRVCVLGALSIAAHGVPHEVLRDDTVPAAALPDPAA